MVAQEQAGPFWTVEQYLSMERCSNVKHEYHRGQVYAMSGGSQDHSQVAVNVCTLLRTGVRGSGCRALNSDIKIRQSQEDYVYADAVVTCDERDKVPGQDWIDYPILVVEVLSKSTALHDRGDKFEGYRQITSLREYVLIEYWRRAAVVWRRDDAGAWTDVAYGPDGEIALISVALTLPMDLIYEDSGV